METIVQCTPARPENCVKTAFSVLLRHKKWVSYSGISETLPRTGGFKKESMDGLPGVYETPENNILNWVCTHNFPVVERIPNSH